MHPDAAYWDQGEKNVPDMTGAKHLLDARDLRVVFEHFGVPIPIRSVLDVGCGTGRLAALCQDYYGVDISVSARDYCRAHGILADLIGGAHDLAVIRDPFDLVTCISVFTHIDRSERQGYLHAFAAIKAPALLVDIIPGDGAGNVALWTARPDDMMADLTDAGFTTLRWVDQAWDKHTHRYFYAEKS